MNLWLNPHGIWYYRKVAILPCGRRKDVKKSLQIRAKSAVRNRVYRKCSPVCDLVQCRVFSPQISHNLALPATNPACCLSVQIICSWLVGPVWSLSQNGEGEGSGELA